MVFFPERLLIWLKMVDTGKLLKQEKDFSETVEKELPVCQELAKVSVSVNVLINATLRIFIVEQNGKVKEALENLLALEKQTRMVSLLYIGIFNYKSTIYLIFPFSHFP